MSEGPRLRESANRSHRIDRSGDRVLPGGSAQPPTGARRREHHPSVASHRDRAGGVPSPGTAALAGRRDRGVRGQPSDQCVGRGGRRDGGREHACPLGGRHPPPAGGLPSAARSPPRRARDRLLSAGEHPHQRDHRRDHPGGLRRHRGGALPRRVVRVVGGRRDGDPRGRPVPPHVQLVACTSDPTRMESLRSDRARSRSGRHLVPHPRHEPPHPVPHAPGSGLGRVAFPAARGGARGTGRVGVRDVGGRRAARSLRGSDALGGDVHAPGVQCHGRAHVLLLRCDRRASVSVRGAPSRMPPPTSKSGSTCARPSSRA